MATSAKTAKTTQKAKKLANAPKRPPTAYLAYTSHVRKTEPDAIAGMKFAEQREYLTKRWKDLDEAEKQKFEKEYALLRDKYKNDFDSYKKSPQFAIDCKEAGIKLKKKRPKSAYNIFVSTEYPTMTGTFAECAQKLSQKWREMSEKEKEKYVKMSEDEKKQFKENEQPEE